MPGGDHSGPRGQGPLSGRGHGYCGGRARPGWADDERAPGDRGRGGGGGRGIRRRHRRFQQDRGWLGPGWATEPTPPEEEQASLKQEMRRLSSRLRAVRNRLKQLRSPDEG